MKTKLLALALLAGGSLFAQSRFSIGVGVGVGPSYGPGYYSPAPVYVRPPMPGPRYVWVDGYMARTRYGRTWVPGHWERRGYRTSYRTTTRYYQDYGYRR